MLNRRHLRIKVLQALYAFYQSNMDNRAHAEKELMRAVDRIYDLYLYLFLVFPELKALSEYRMEENKKKIMPSEEELNPNLKFVNNELIKLIEQNKKLRFAAEERKVNWVGDEHQEMFKKMWVNLKENEVYFDYMNNQKEGFEEDKAFFIDLFKEIANSELLYDFFDEKSIHWIDDIDLSCSMLLKTVKTLEENQELEIMDLFKDPRDEQDFIKDLFRETIDKDSENEKIIDDLTKNWELDRIAKMDIILMKMAMTEFQIFETIPTKVTMNEYIEISKFYSTPKSNGFINGILDKAIHQLNKEKKILKVGRGLIE